jgi:hypothetical protein
MTAVDDALQVALDEYRRAIEKQEAEFGSFPQASEDLTDSLAELAADRAAAERNSLRSPQDILDSYRLQLIQSSRSSITVTDAVDEEEAYLKGVLASAGPASARFLMNSGMSQIVVAAKDVAGAASAKVARVQALIEELIEAFDSFSRGDFEALAGNVTTTVLAKAQSIRADAIAVGASLAGFGSVGAVRSSIRNLCAAIDDLLNDVIAPNTYTNRVLEILVELHAELISLVDLLIELNRDLVGLLELREKITASIPSVELILGFLETLTTTLGDFAESAANLATKPKLLRVDVAMAMAREVVASAQVICKADIDVDNLISSAAQGALLTALEALYGPLVDQLTPFIETLQENVDIWLSGLRNHVQVDTGVEFTNTTTAILAAMDTILTITAVIVSGTPAGIPGTPVPGGQAIEAMGAAGFSGNQADYQKGRFSAERTASIELSTAAGKLADALRAKLAGLRNAGALTPIADTHTKRVIAFLDKQHRSQLQSAAVQRTIFSEAVADKNANLGSARAAVSQIEILVEGI